MPAGAALPAQLQTQLMSLLSTDPVKGAAMLKDLPVLAGDAGLGEAMASPSCCWAYFDLYSCLTKLESWERMSRELREELVRPRLKRVKWGARGNAPQMQFLLEGWMWGGLSSQQLTIQKCEQLVRKTRPFVLFLHKCLTANNSPTCLSLLFLILPNSLSPVLWCLKRMGSPMVMHCQGHRFWWVEAVCLYQRWFQGLWCGQGWEKQGCVSPCVCLLSLAGCWICVMINVQRTNFSHHQWLGCKFS